MYNYRQDQKLSGPDLPREMESQTVSNLEIASETTIGARTDTMIAKAIVKAKERAKAKMIGATEAKETGKVTAREPLIIVRHAIDIKQALVTVRTANMITPVNFVGANTLEWLATSRRLHQGARDSSWFRRGPLNQVQQLIR